MGARRSPRYSQRDHRCDSPTRAAGYGDGRKRGAHQDHNNFFGDALGFATDGLLGGRASRVHAGLRTDRAQPNSSRTTSTRICRARTSIRPCPLRSERENVDRGRQQQRGPRRPHVRQPTSRRDALRRPRRLRPGLRERLRLQPRGRLDLIRQSLSRQRDGTNARREAPAETGSTSRWDDVRGQTGNCLVRQRWRCSRREQRDLRPDRYPHACVRVRDCRRPPRAVERVSAELLSCLVLRPGPQPCAWFETPPRPSE